SLLAQVHTEAMLGVVLEEGVSPSGTLSGHVVDGVGRGSSGAAPDGGASGSVGDEHMLAEQLGDQTAVAGLGTACAGAGELQQGLTELAVLHIDGFSSSLGLQVDVGSAVIEHSLLSSLALLGLHGDSLGGADSYALAAA